MQIVIKREEEMKVFDLVKELKLTVFSGAEMLNQEISGVYVSDLLSDVMGNAKEGEVWITLQTHENVVAVASLKDLAAVIFVKNVQPDENTLERSMDENIPLLGTSESTFEITGKLFNVLKTP